MDRRLSAGQLLMLVAAVLFILAALVAQGVVILGIRDITFALVAFAAWVASGAV